MNRSGWMNRWSGSGEGGNRTALQKTGLLLVPFDGNVLADGDRRQAGLAAHSHQRAAGEPDQQPGLRTSIDAFLHAPRNEPFIVIAEHELFGADNESPLPARQRRATVGQRQKAIFRPDAVARGNPSMHYVGSTDEVGDKNV